MASDIRRTASSLKSGLLLLTFFFIDLLQYGREVSPVFCLPLVSLLGPIHGPVPNCVQEIRGISFVFCGMWNTTGLPLTPHAVPTAAHGGLDQSQRNAQFRLTQRLYLDRKLA